MAIIRFDDAEFDSAAGDLRRGGASVRLRPKTARLLTFLLQHHGETLSHETILDEVWSDRVVTENTLMQSVRELRSALADDAAAPRFIETLHGRGYRWIGPRPEASDASPARAGAAGSLPKALAAAAIVLALAAAGGAAISRFQPRAPVAGAEAVGADLSRAREARARGRADLAERYYQAAILQDAGDLAATAGLTSLLYEAGQWDRALETARTAIAAAGDDDPAALAALRVTAGRIAHARGRLGEAEAHFLAARALVEASPSAPVVRAAALDGLSRVYADQGRASDYASARAAALDPLLVTEQLDAFAEGLLSAGTTIGPTLNESWGLSRLERALQVFETIGDRAGVARARAALGANHAAPEAAREAHLGAALSFYRQAGHVPGELAVLGLIASFETERFHAAAALAAVARSAEIVDALGADRERASVEYRRGLALMADAVSQPPTERGARLAEAERAFAAAAARYDALDIGFDGIAPRMHRGAALLELGRAEEALAAFRDAASRYHAFPFPPGEIGARMGEAAALGALGRAADAERLLTELERAAPQTAPVLAQVRDLVAREGGAATGAPTATFFSILITAERSMADSSDQ